LVVVKSASEGRLKLPEPSSEHVGGTFSALLKLLVASWTVWTPLLAIYSVFGDANIAFMLAVFAAMLLIPSSVLLTALGYSLVDLANPLTIGSALRSLGLRYWEAAGVFSFAMLGLFAVGGYLEPLLAIQPVPFVGDVILIVIAHIVQVGLLTIGSFAVGWCAYEAGDKLLLWTEADLMVAQVPDASPRAQAVRRLEDRIDDELDVDIELSTKDPLVIVPNDVAHGSSITTYEVEDLPEDQGNIEIALSAKLPETLHEALTARDTRTSVAMYESIQRASGVAPVLTPELRLQLADSLVAERRYQAASTEYRAIAEMHPDHVLAPHAIARLADLLSAQLARPDMAEKLLTLLERKYPEFRGPQDCVPSDAGAP